jgi:hypothetical protein
MLEEHLTVPFITEILGVAVRVARVDLMTLKQSSRSVAIDGNGNGSRFSTFRCPHPPPDGWEWIEAYRYWARGGR